MSSPLDSYVIKPKRPLRFVVWLIIAIVVSGLLQWYWFNSNNGNTAQLIEQNQQMTEQVAAMKSELMQQSELLKNQEQVQAMQQATAQQLQNRLQQLPKRSISTLPSIHLISVMFRLLRVSSILVKYQILNKSASVYARKTKY